MKTIIELFFKHTLECEINVPAGINMLAGKVYENDKHACWKI